MSADRMPRTCEYCRGALPLSGEQRSDPRWGCLDLHEKCAAELAALDEADAEAWLLKMRNPFHALAQRHPGASARVLASCFVALQTDGLGAGLDGTDVAMQLYAAIRVARRLTGYDGFLFLGGNLFPEFADEWPPLATLEHYQREADRFLADVHAHPAEFQPQ